MKTLLAAGLLLLLSFPCKAAVVFDNGNNIESAEYSSNDGADVNEVADDFVLSADTGITGVHWKGVYGEGTAPGPDDFSILFYKDNGSGAPTDPGTAIYNAHVGSAGRVLTGEFAFGGSYSVYSYSASIPQFNAVAGTTYWLEIFDHDISVYWLWSNGLGAGNSVTTNFSNSWSTQNAETTFQLTDDPAPAGAPESGSLAVWSTLGCIGLLFARRCAS